MVDIKTLELSYFSNGEPVPYKLKDGTIINIYPILVKDFPMYEWANQILQIRKNEINDIKIIQMTYLEFLLKETVNNNEVSKYQLYYLLKLCLHENLIGILDDNNEPYEKNGKQYIAIVDDDNNIKHTIVSKDFDEISKIILFQNDINYDDRYISPDMRKEIEQYYKLKYKDSTPPTIEKKKAFVISKTGISLNEINNMVFRMFDQVYQASIDSEIYIGNKIIQASQKYDVKGNIEHPMFEVKKDPILSAMGGDAEVFENKIQQINNN